MEHCCSASAPFRESFWITAMASFSLPLSSSHSKQGAFATHLFLGGLSPNCLQIRTVSVFLNAGSVVWHTFWCEPFYRPAGSVDHICLSIHILGGCSLGSVRGESACSRGVTRGKRCRQCSNTIRFRLHSYFVVRVAGFSWCNHLLFSISSLKPVGDDYQ